MSSNANVISKKFYNRYRNYNPATGLWDLNLGEYATRLVGNVGDQIQLVEQMDINVEVNPNEAIHMEFNTTADPTFGTLTTNSLNFMTEGLWNGALVDVFFDGVIVSNIPIGIISGVNYSVLNIEKALLVTAGLKDNDIRPDIVIKLVTAPKYLNYKYGLNPLDLTPPNYKSPFDDNEQSYYAFNIPTTPIYIDMIWSGRQEGSNLGGVRVKYDTTSGYNHTYTIEHTFKIPWFLDGEQNNVINQKPPVRFASTNSLKYGNGFFFGGVNSDVAAIFEDVGGTTRGSGNVGYYGENFAGFKNFYSVEDVLITNPLGTGKIEVTETNTVTYKISSASPVGLNPGDRVEIMHSKSPSQNEYQNKEDAFDDIWLVEYLEQTAGAAPTGGSIIKNLIVTPNLGKFEVSFDVVYSASQQSRLSEGDSLVISYNIATQDITNPELVDRTRGVVDAEPVTEDIRQPNLVTKWQPDIYNHWDFFGGTKFFTNFDGYNGDLLGMQFTFDTDSTRNTVIKSMKLYEVASSTGSRFGIITPIAFAPIHVVKTVANPYIYQQLNTNIQGALNVPATDDLNKIILWANAPAPGTPTQTWTGSVGVRLGWQDWIANGAVPGIYYNPVKPNNNQNQKTDNYSSGLVTIKLMLLVELESNDVDGNLITTEYELYSDSSDILDFDDNGGSAGNFTGVVKVYDSNGVITDDLDSSLPNRIDIEFPHTLGVINKNDLWGRIWIEQENGTAQPWDLSTDKDFTSANNWLQPSDSVTPGNTQFVELISVNNLVTLRCSTDPSKILNGSSYNIYGRLGNKL